MSIEKPSRRDFIKKAVTVGVALGAFGDSVEAAQSMEGKFSNIEGNCEFVFTSANPDEAHNSANVFSREVGNALKATYPSKILLPNVKLEVININGQRSYRFTWTCKIVKSSETEANYYFDRRGTMLSGKTLSEAKTKVEAELEKSGKVQTMRKGFKNANMPASFIKDSFSGSDREGYWYVKEFFMVAPK